MQRLFVKSNSKEESKVVRESKKPTSAHPGLSLWTMPFADMIDSYLQKKSPSAYSQLTARLELANPSDLAILEEKAKAIFFEMEDAPNFLPAQKYIILGKAVQLGLCQSLKPDDAQTYFRFALLAEDDRIAKFEMYKSSGISKELKSAADEMVGDAHLLLGQHYLEENEGKKALEHFMIAGNCGCFDGYWHYSQHAQKTGGDYYKETFPELTMAILRNIKGARRVFL